MAFKGVFKVEDLTRMVALGHDLSPIGGGFQSVSCNSELHQYIIEKGTKRSKVLDDGTETNITHTLAVECTLTNAWENENKFAGTTSGTLKIATSKQKALCFGTIQVAEFSSDVKLHYNAYAAFVRDSNKSKMTITAGVSGGTKWLSLAPVISIDSNTAILAIAKAEGVTVEIPENVQ